MDAVPRTQIIYRKRRITKIGHVSPGWRRKEPHGLLRDSWTSDRKLKRNENRKALGRGQRYIRLGPD